MNSTIESLLSNRNKTHGEFTSHAKIVQELKRAMRYDNRTTCDLTDVQKEALDMIVHKIGRILAGNSNFRDHWDDIAGYAILAAERCGDERP